MPRIVDRLAATIAAGVFRHRVPVLTDDDAIRIRMISTGRPTALALTKYLLLSKRTRQVFDTMRGYRRTARTLTLKCGN